MRSVASFDGLEGSMATTIGDRPFTMIGIAGIAWFGMIFATNKILFGHKTSRGFKGKSFVMFHPCVEFGMWMFKKNWTATIWVFHYLINSNNWSECDRFPSFPRYPIHLPIIFLQDFTSTSGLQATIFRHDMPRAQAGVIFYTLDRAKQLCVAPKRWPGHRGGKL